MHRKVTILLTLMCALPLLLNAGSITGKVTDAQSGKALPGANVMVVGTHLGAASDATGMYHIVNVPDGDYTIKTQVIGYEPLTKEVRVSGTVTLNFQLGASTLELSALEVMASRATRETPVAYSDVAKEEMSLRLGSRDIPLVLNNTPSVYATNQGGGAGDARVNVRGFNQRNVAIMINGVPVNDMENGWLYWSNWDGVGDATSSIQLQRGLSATNLATPSIGGTMNIITDPAAQEWGWQLKQEFGDWGFMKSTATVNTGLINDTYAFSGTIVRKLGDGYYTGTWTDAWAYYFGGSYAISENDRFEIYAVGAPQRHGQNIYKQNMAVYDQDFARDEFDSDVLNEDGDDSGYNDPNGIPDVFDKFNEAGRDYNQNVADISNYNGEQYWAMYTDKDGVDRFDDGFLNERENFFHKPLVNLNWFHNFDDQMRLSSVLYWSGGQGGGTGTYGNIMHQSYEGVYDHQYGKYYYYGSPWSWDWDATVAMNRDSTHIWIDKYEYDKEAGESLGILRNSRNNQWNVGLISKLTYDVSEELTTVVGIDWRTAEIDHFREVRDLLGGDYYMDDSNDFNTTTESQTMKLGDKIDYYNTNTVDWYGLLAQAQYKSGPLAAYGMAGYSTVSYDFVDHFKDDGNGNEYQIEANNLDGTQFKAGASYQINDGLGVYTNIGIVSRVPIFDDIIDDVSGLKNEDQKNQKFTSLEGGANFFMDRFTAKANVYMTRWEDRAFRNQEFEVQADIDNDGIVDDIEVLAFFTGVEQEHMGFELEASYQPCSYARLDGSVSIGDWTYTDDAGGSFRITEYDMVLDTTFYIKDLKVGDAPQTQMALGTSIFPMPGLTAQLLFKFYDNHYSDFNPFGRVDPDDREDSWQAPAYSLVDLHLSYNVPAELTGGYNVQLFAHIFNLLDETYIQDALDNSPYNAWDYDHDADDAEVFFGMPRSFNAGFYISR